MTSTTTTSRIDALFNGAVAGGALSKSALQAINIRDVGNDINNALGVSVDDVTASEVVLVTQLIDDSGSIRFVSGNMEEVRKGHNLILDSLADTKTIVKGGVLASCSYLNGALLYPYMTVDTAVRMDTSNFNPMGGTPLYRQAIVTLATVLAKYQQFADTGVPCRTVTAIITDGGDSTGDRPDKVRKIVEDMLRAECHIIAGVGIDDGSTDFKRVFGDMGIRPEWILTPGNSPSEIRRAFAMLSQSATRASQSAKTFSQNAMGGFASP